MHSQIDPDSQETTRVHDGGPPATVSEFHRRTRGAAISTDQAREEARAADRLARAGADRCAWLGSILAALLLGYNTLVAVGKVAPIPIGVGPMWAGLAGVLFFPKIARWAVRCEGRQVRAEIAEMRDDVAELRDAVRATLESVTDLVRDAQEQDDDRFLHTVQADLDKAQRRTGNVRQMRG